MTAIVSPPWRVVLRAKAMWKARSRILTGDEAEFVFHELFTIRLEEYEDEDRDGSLSKEAGALEVEATHIAMNQTERRMEADFHRVRGEAAFAQLVLNDWERATDHIVDGELSLIHDDEWLEESREEPNHPVVMALSERVAAIATAETLREHFLANAAFDAALPRSDPASGVAAVRAVREIGLISLEQSFGLLTNVLFMVFHQELSEDREYLRLATKRESLETARSAGAVIEEWKVRSGAECEEGRADVLLAMCLRRFGEHEAANVLMTRPEEFDRFDRIVDECGAG